MTRSPVTPWQTLGPYFDPRLLRAGDADLSRRRPGGPAAEGEVIEIAGTVCVRRGEPQRNALIEIWQASHHGTFDHPDDERPGGRRTRPIDPNFRGFGRCLTDGQGAYRFKTIRPGPTPHPDGGLQAPCINVSIFCVGLLRRLLTRIYFANDPRNEDDPVLQSIADRDHRRTLLAREVPAQPVPSYLFDIVMQGEGETAYFID